MNEKNRSKLIELNEGQLRQCAETDRKLDSKQRYAWDRADDSRAARVLHLMKGFHSALGVVSMGKQAWIALDAGAGPGFRRDAIISILDVPTYSGIEFQPEVAYCGRQRGIWQCAIEDIGAITANHYDFVYAGHSLEHCFDAKAALVSLFACLKPGGVMGHITPHVFPDNDPAHVSKLSILQWLDLYRKVGFEILFSDVHQLRMPKEVGLTLEDECHIVVYKPLHKEVD